MFATILRELRKQNKLTQGELARALNVSTSTIGMYERGERMPPPDMLLAIAEYFGTDVNTLLCVKPDRRVQMFSVTYPADFKPSLDDDDEERAQFEELFALFSAVPEADRPLVLGMIRAALNSKGLL